jgi:hypothetical protein
MSKKATYSRLSEAEEHALYRRKQPQVAHDFPMEANQIVVYANEYYN